MPGQREMLVRKPYNGKRATLMVIALTRLTFANCCLLHVAERCCGTERDMCASRSQGLALCHVLYVINMRLAMCVVSHTSVSFAVETLHHLHPYSALPPDIEKYLFKRIRVLEQK